MAKSRGQQWQKVHDEISRRGTVMTPELHDWYKSEGVSKARTERPGTVLAAVRDMGDDGDAAIVDFGSQGRRVTHSTPCRYQS